MSPNFPPPCFAYTRSELLEAKDGKAICRFTPNEDMENPYGLVQGGILAAMLDNVIGPAVISVAPERQSSTIHLSLSYLRSVKPGDVLLGTATVIHHGRSQAYVEASLEREGDRAIVIRATATNLFLTSRT